MYLFTGKVILSTIRFMFRSLLTAINQVFKFIPIFKNIYDNFFFINNSQPLKFMLTVFVDLLLASIGCTLIEQ
jgi:uncharacterized membrane protein